MVGSIPTFRNPCCLHLAPSTPNIFIEGVANALVDKERKRRVGGGDGNGAGGGGGGGRKQQKETKLLNGYRLATFNTRGQGRVRRQDHNNENLWRAGTGLRKVPPVNCDDDDVDFLQFVRSSSGGTI